MTDADLHKLIEALQRRLKVVDLLILALRERTHDNVRLSVSIRAPKCEQRIKRITKENSARKTARLAKNAPSLTGIRKY